MSWENAPLPENNIDPDDKPLQEVVLLLVGVLGIVLFLSAALSAGAGWLASWIPFSVERRFADAVVPAWSTPENQDPLRAEAEKALQHMADRIGADLGMTPSMPLRVHLLEDEGINAFASIGGHLFVMRGLLEKIPHENALVMLLGHEIGHIVHRDPAVALVRGLSLSVLLGGVFGLSDTEVLRRSMEAAGLMAVLSFSRDQERAADEAGLRSLQAWYGHTSGAADLFATLSLAHAEDEAPPVLLSSHPALEERITHTRSVQDSLPTTPLSGPIAAYAARSRSVSSLDRAVTGS